MIRWLVNEFMNFAAAVDIVLNQSDSVWIIYAR